MQVISCKSYRNYYKRVIRQIEADNRDEDFIGHSIIKDGKTIFGFFELFHADKHNIDNFISPVLNIANDWQVIYELLQNAFDARSKHFAIVYDEKHLIAFNDGNPLSSENVRALLNIGQTTKDHRKDIGKYGIGFKIVHRLIGGSNGLNELKNLCGPIIFSWKGNSKLLEFLELKSVNDIEFVDFNEDLFNKDEFTWLFKILITNFPCGLNEEIKDFNYERTNSAFTFDELYEFINFTRNKLFKDDLSEIYKFKQGTIIFLNIGQGKKELIDTNFNKIGLSNSLSIFNEINTSKIEKVYINDVSNPIKPSNLIFEKFYLSKNDDDFKDLNLDDDNGEVLDVVHIFFGYRDIINNETNYKKFEDEITNLYLFFPIEDERYGFNFIIHSNKFDNLSDRTRLERTVRNNNILRILSKKLIELLEDYKKTDFLRYISIFAAFLSSDKKNWTDKESKEYNWIYNNFFGKIIEYFKNSIPTIDRLFEKKERVKINSTNLKIKSADFGLEDIHWFYFTENELLLKSAKDKAILGIGELNIVDLIKLGSIDKINDWLERNNNLDVFFENLSRFKYWSDVLQDNEIVERLKQLRIFKFSNYGIKSLYEVINSSLNQLFLKEDFIEIDDLLKPEFDTYIIRFDNENLKNFFIEQIYYLKDKKQFLDNLTKKLETIHFQRDINQVEKLINFFERDNITVADKLLFINDIVSNYVILKPKKDDLINYYLGSEDQSLHKILQQNFPQKFYPINENLFNLFKRKDSIFKKDQIIDFLVKKLEETKLINLIDYILDDKKEIKKLYLKRITRVKINNSERYDKNTFEHKIILLASELESLDELRNKIIIHDDEKDRDIELNNIINDEISLLPTKKGNKLYLSKILPNYNLDCISINKIKENFYELSNEIKNKLFNVPENRNYELIFNKLLEIKTLTNSFQLAFVLLYLSRCVKEYPTLDFEIFTMSGKEKFTHNKKFYIENLCFLDESYILNKDYYEDLRDIIIYENEQFFYLNNYNIGIFLYPCIISNNNNIGEIELEGLKEDLDENQIICFIDHIKNLLNNSQLILKEIKTKTHLSFAKKNNFSSKIYPSKYANDDEKLPEYINEIINDETIKPNLVNILLEFLGVKTEASFIVRLRKFFLDEMNIPVEINSELDKLDENDLKNFLLFISKQDIIFNDKYHTKKFNLIQKIYSKLNLSNFKNDINIPIPFIKELDGENLNYAVHLININNILLIDEEKLSELKQNKLLKNLIKENGNLYFITENILGSDHNKKIFIKVDIQKIISNTNQLRKLDLKEPILEAYSIWEKDTGYKIFTYQNNLKYDVILLYTNKKFGELINSPKFEVDKDNEVIYINEFYISMFTDITEILDEIISKNDELKSILEDLKQKLQNPSETREKFFEAEFEISKEHNTNDEVLKYFKVDEKKSFKEKLLELLNLKASEQENSVYHFTHIENAVKILKNKKIYCRAKVDGNFKDSAGKSFINTTNEIIKNYVRFYFRPKTPTQYYNENLGKKTKQGDLPQCPVPVFLKFSISEILENPTYDVYVSNGNLRHYPNLTQFGNSYEFLKSFDFINLYKDFKDFKFDDRFNFIKASQQEFLIKDEFDFSNLNFYKIICQNDAAKDTLIYLIKIDEDIDFMYKKFLFDRIKVDNSYFYNENPYIEINRQNELLHVALSKNSESVEKGHKIKVILKKNNSEFFIFSCHYFDININNVEEIEIDYINSSNNSEWLIYKYGYKF